MTYIRIGKRFAIGLVIVLAIAAVMGIGRIASWVAGVTGWGG